MSSLPDPLLSSRPDYLGGLGIPTAGAAEPTWTIPNGIKTVAVNGYPMACQEAASTPYALR